MEKEGHQPFHYRTKFEEVGALDLEMMSEMMSIVAVLSMT